MIINKMARDIIVSKKSEKVYFHDQWAYMVCSCFGDIKYVKEPLVKYRRLTENVTAEGKGFISAMKWRIKKLVLDNGFKKFKYQILDFKKLFYSEASFENKKILDLFTEKYNLKNAIKKLFYPKRFRRKLLDEFMIRFLFLFGII